MKQKPEPKCHKGFTFIHRSVVSYSDSSSVVGVFQEVEGSAECPIKTAHVSGQDIWVQWVEHVDAVFHESKQSLFIKCKI